MLFKDYCSDILITKFTTCTTVSSDAELQKELLANNNYEKGLIDLICEVFSDKGIHELRANDDANT